MARRSPNLDQHWFCEECFAITVHTMVDREFAKTRREIVELPFPGVSPDAMTRKRECTKCSKSVETIEVRTKAWKKLLELASLGKQLQVAAERTGKEREQFMVELKQLRKDASAIAKRLASLLGAPS